MTRKLFEMVVDAVEAKLLEDCNDVLTEKQRADIAHIATTLMRKAFVSGQTGNALDRIAAKMEMCADNPLAMGIAAAMRWSYEQGQAGDAEFPQYSHTGMKILK